MHQDSRFFPLTEALQTPFLIFDLNQIKANYSTITAAFPGVRVHYAVKSNPEPRILQLFDDLGAGFEVASLNETERLLELGVSPDKIICMHPIKSPQFLSYLHAHGITTMAVDSYEEVDKIAACAPDSRLVVRISVNNEGSLWNLNGKFGLDSTEIPRFFEYVVSKNLSLYGLTFQVGSQCENVDNWVQALRLCGVAWDAAERHGYQLQFLSLGGGLPANYHHPVPAIPEIGSRVMQELSQPPYVNSPSLQLAMEPGRSLVASAGILVTSVFGLATRGMTRWAYIETGTYNGLIEAIETSDRNFYPLFAKDGERPHHVYHIGGPSCVSLDMPFESVELPELNVGDRLYIRSAGAYTAACATPFNGFPAPSIHYWQDMID